MLKPSPLARFLLHIANLAAIAFFLLPLVAVTIGSLQSEKSLQADTRSVLPHEWTLDNFRVIFSGGEQKGAIFEQVTYLPDNVKKIYYAFANSVVIADLGHLPDTGLRLALAFTVARLRAALGGLADEHQRPGALRAADRADDPALRGLPHAGPAELASWA